MKTKIIGIFSILALSINIYSIVTVNDIVCAFGESAEKKYIEENVIDGSTQYLISKANATLLLSEFEKSAKSEFSFAMALEYTEKSIEALEAALVYYNAAMDIGKRLGYSTQKENWFKAFKYDEYIQANKLNPTIATKVKNLLSSYDIIGIYQQNIDNLREILTLLHSIRNELKEKRKPTASVFWGLLQCYSEASLFGNYSTVMGKTILGNCSE